MLEGFIISKKSLLDTTYIFCEKNFNIPFNYLFDSYTEKIILKEKLFKD
jgi:hypothetical protein